MRIIEYCTVYCLHRIKVRLYIWSTACLFLTKRLFFSLPRAKAICLKFNKREIFSICIMSDVSSYFKKVNNAYWSFIKLKYVLFFCPAILPVFPAQCMNYWSEYIRIYSAKCLQRKNKLHTVHYRYLLGKTEALFINVQCRWGFWA
jgi:hypothetical protein